MFELGPHYCEIIFLLKLSIRVNSPHPRIFKSLEHYYGEIIFLLSNKGLSREYKAEALSKILQRLGGRMGVFLIP